MGLIAALPMYDWPEARAEIDAEWSALRERFAGAGISAPDRLLRRNGDLPPVPGGIRDHAGTVIAADPATLPPDELELDVLWRHPDLLCGQTCWGPMELGLRQYVAVLGQPDYSSFPGGSGIFYRSAIVMRRQGRAMDMAPPGNGAAAIPLDRLRRRRFVFNNPASLSGLIGLRRDLVACRAIGNETRFAFFWSSITATGSHRQSFRMVVEGRADVAAIDCRSLELCRRYETGIDSVSVVGWTALRRGLPWIAAGALARSLRLGDGQPLSGH